MTVNQLIAELQKIAETHGEMECLLETHTDEGLGIEDLHSIRIALVDASRLNRLEVFPSGPIHPKRIHFRVLLQDYESSKDCESWD